MTKTVFDDWPMFGLVSDVRPALADALHAERPAVLATLGAAESGAPLGRGVQMLFTHASAAGFLSGGCVEADVALHAAEVLEDGHPKTLIYGEGGAPDIRLPCGGRVVIRLERIAPDDGAAHRLLQLEQARSPALWLSDGCERICLAPEDAPPDAYVTLLEGATDRVAMNEEGDRFARRFDPQQRLIVVGHDPIALATAQLGLKMGWSTTLVRPLGPETSPPLEGIAYRRGEPGAELDALRPDAWTAVVIATHSHEHDHAAAFAAVCSAAGYVGLLGGRRRLPARLGELAADGAPAQALARIRAPVGLPLGASTPYEIAVSIVAEIIQAAHESRVEPIWPIEIAPVAA